MSAFVDLHCHSTASDGTLAPRDVVKGSARDSNLTAMALTDHDTVAGCADAADEAKKLNIDFLCGIEISAEFPHPGTMHILGYGVDPNSAQLKNLTETLIAGRDNRNPRIVEKLNEMGVAVTMAEWENEAKGAVLGRPHFAAILARKGYVSSIKQAFDKYIGQGAPAYFDKERLSPKQAIERIHSACGLAVLAHPIQLRSQNDAQLEQTIKNLVDLKLDGLEVIHSDHSPQEIEKFTRIADQYGLLKTGGSDFHGTNKKGIQLGVANSKKIPRKFFDELRSKIDSTFSRCGYVASCYHPKVLHAELEKLLNWVIPDIEDCRSAAQQIRLDHPNLTDEKRAIKAVKDSRKWAVGIGAATGIAASPITMLPAAVADAAAMLRLEGKLAGTVAALLDPESLNDKEIFRRDILRAVFPGAVSQALRKLGVRAGEEATKNVVRKLMTREAGKEIGERAVKFLGIRLSEKAVATKTVPLVGAGIGAAWNWLEIQAVGCRAIDYHLGRESSGKRFRKKVISIVRESRKPRD